MPAWATGRRTPLRRQFRLSRGTWVVLIGSIAALGLFALLPEARFGLDGGSLDGPVERVADGDTIEIAGQRIRLVGLDAPEWDQTCTNADGDTWSCGAAAADRMRQLVRGEMLSCAPEGHDRYGRLLAACTNGAGDIAQMLVRDGLAIATDRYFGAEAEAREARRGLWQGKFVTPAAWRDGAGRGDGAGGGNPSRFERFLAWLGGLLTS
jgi:endonuclease YncB( thermonuclease family)